MSANSGIEHELIRGERETVVRADDYDDDGRGFGCGKGTVREGGGLSTESDTEAPGLIVACE